MPRKKIHLNRGDVLTMPISENWVGFGQLIDFSKTKEAFLIAVFNLKHTSDKAIDCRSIVRQEIIFLGYTNDAKLFHGDWKVVGNEVDNLSGIQKPFFKLGIAPDLFIVDYLGNKIGHIDENTADELTFQTIIAPIRYENALRAHFGFTPWLELYDKQKNARVIEIQKITQRCSS